MEASEELRKSENEAGMSEKQERNKDQRGHAQRIRTWRTSRHRVTSKQQAVLMLRGSHRGKRLGGRETEEARQGKLSWGWTKGKREIT